MVVRPILSHKRPTHEMPLMAALCENSKAMNKQLTIYVDVDDTLVRSFSSKRIPMPAVIEHVKELHEQGVELYCWSSGGKDYAKSSAAEFGIEHCFAGFLPKPNILIDDLALSKWPRFSSVHPNQCTQHTMDSYNRILDEN